MTLVIPQPQKTALRLPLQHPFVLNSSFQPAGDQVDAISALTQGLSQGERNQILLGVTGSGKTFTMANVIVATQRPALVLAPNKTLAAQLYEEMLHFFPHNAVEYFVSYYDYYQPEAYVPRTDTYVEKESSINEQIDRLRHSATRSLLERGDVIIVASVSCIYGLGAVESYSAMTARFHVGQSWTRDNLLRTLTQLHYTRNEIDFSRGSFRVRGERVDIFPSHYENRAWRLSFFGDEIEKITEIDALTGNTMRSLENAALYANSHYVTPGPTLQQAVENIKKELDGRLSFFQQEERLLELQRLRERTTFDIEMLTSTGMCPGIENYSRYLTGRAPGQPPPTLFEYLSPETILIVDESHVTVPQIRAMYRGDARRKGTLSEYGFRLPSCADNRPLKFEEWDAMRPQTIYVSATPGEWELTQTQGVFVEQVIRPTGLVDPVCHVRPVAHQVDDVMEACRETIARGYRVLITTLTKKMAEALCDFLQEANFKVKYLHSDVDTLDRIALIHALRQGVFDILVGINLLREGLDIPECGLVAILDADKEGFLRSRTTLIQTIGRAARNAEGYVILYADVMTESLKAALGETERRRQKQIAYNTLHNITPQSTFRPINPSAFPDAQEETSSAQKGSQQKILLVKDVSHLSAAQRHAHIAQLKKEMLIAAEQLDFERATQLRNLWQEMEKTQQ